MHTQVNTAGWIRDQGGHYVLTSLGNQKTLRRTLEDLTWKKVPSFLSIDTGHGRRVRRSARGRPGTQVGGLPRSGSGSPVRRTRTIKGRKHVEVAYPGLLTAHGAGPPEQVAAWVQGHWGIENRLHVGL